MAVRRLDIVHDCYHNTFAAIVDDYPAGSMALSTFIDLTKYYGGVFWNTEDLLVTEGLLTGGGLVIEVFGLPAASQSLLGPAVRPSVPVLVCAASS